MAAFCDVWTFCRYMTRLLRIKDNLNAGVAGGRQDGVCGDGKAYYLCWLGLCNLRVNVYSRLQFALLMYSSFIAICYGIFLLTAFYPSGAAWAGC